MTQLQWTHPRDIRQRLEKRWAKGDLLRACARPEDTFPLRLALKKPTAAQLLEDFDAARRWAHAWQQAECPALELEWQTTQHRQLGRNSVPVAAIVPSLDAALRHLHRRDDARAYQALVADITRHCPALADWCQRKPLKVLELKDKWPALLAILEWMQANPRPELYIRQLEIPGVHTKLIEGNRGLLAELLDPVLPAHAIDPSAVGARQFEQRYGFRRRPSRLRLRLLDSAQRIAGLDDIELPCEQFAALDVPVSRVYIVENDVTALAFPSTPAAMVIFGQGYGIGRQLAGAQWLKDKEVYYWGDIDTHGFRILSQLREALPHSRSLLMDAATLKAHCHLWGSEPRPHTGPLAHLTAAEDETYRMLGTLKPGCHLRLEQEQIKYSAL
ncbi:MAG: DUF3322 domain-containing protein [Halomonas sp.]|nr:DUF3322 domain-containing protein [Halomonas sp.]MDN6298136.1 DUF3322 domain-containing protein [Halomonas sp.]MDN6315505.1 DUF3322 domain-containing protein [Halomonas sp.]MDN6336848.1 DUF3322 domain-containing protein [Halomonas sp.]